MHFSQKKMGEQGNLINGNGIQQFITNNELSNLVILKIKDKQYVLRIGGIITKNILPSDCEKLPSSWTV
jgi:hypothetical protein